MNTKKATALGLCIALLGIYGCTNRVNCHDEEKLTGDEKLVAFKAESFGDETQETIEVILKENGALHINIDEDNAVVAMVSSVNYDKLLETVKNFKDLT